MNFLKYLFLLCTVSFFFAACNKEERDFVENPTVDTYISMLKKGTYNLVDENGFRTIPNFTQEHIPALLEYADDFTIMPQRYPIHPVSSAVGPIRLGEAILWTIEGIIQNTKYASYSGNLCKKVIVNEEITSEPTTNEEVLEVAKLYKLWWNGQYPFNKVHDKFSVHPLEDTSFYWN
ncbi:DUF4943 family protein [Bacteroides sp. 519]|uniref:DUF4943 family protein n=1 Tax=Bacteroides sp. 519 TaxID=2302937 RepID=UPI0013D70665|nr:DUF4943 family protein [Bacteroides sp. 519]NDV56627.1 DUF4943 domain-containing protein [Bacteroides sp. 519]